MIWPNPKGTEGHEKAHGPKLDKRTKQTPKVLYDLNFIFFLGLEQRRGEALEGREEDEEPSQKMDGFFPVELFLRILAKATQTLGFCPASENPQATSSARENKARFLFSQGPSKRETVPFPEA